jgi:hypothetical protein
VKDFDKNGKVEQIMTYSMNGKEYPFYAKDELERAVPELKKYYLTYGEVAGQTVQYIFYNLFEGYQELKADNLASGVFFQEGDRKFSFKPFPAELQMAPLFDFASAGERGWLAAGNFTGVMPYEGRYDAQPATFFSFNSSTGTMDTRLFANTRNRDVRRIYPIEVNGKHHFLFGVNNEGVIMASNR